MSDLQIDHEQAIKDFASRGFLILTPQQLGIEADVHKRVYEQEKAAYHANQPVTPASIPDVLEVLRAPGLTAVCNQLVGENWAIVPFTHNASFTSGARDQHWHKDDNGPYNARKQRHHQAIQIEMLYFPQDVKEDMGPTAIIPYSQYWTFNHEENHDNFAGADHLDFDYVIEGMEREPVSGPDSKYDVDDIIHARTAHDKRMRDAVSSTKWPLVKQLEAAPLKAGSIVIYSHNTFHRGNHRRDDWQNWHDNPRFMWRFWLYRTTEHRPAAMIKNSSSLEIDWPGLGIDPLTHTDLSEASDDVTTVWRYHYHWLKTNQPPAARAEALNLSKQERDREAMRLFSQLQEKHNEAEPRRIGAAYKLASIGDAALALKLLSKALHDNRESVRRAATYGLIALGEEATATFIEATTSASKWVRKAGVYGLGDTSHLTKEVLEAVTSSLEKDSSVYVRSVAAGTLGCLGRRAMATEVGTSLIPACLKVLINSLEQEENRLAMDKAQGRSIKFVRPTDDSDVCEGSGIDYGLERFEPVRSAVRENVLWSIVILCSHGSVVLGSALGPTIETLKEVIREDKNVFCVGLAMDALTRLAYLKTDQTSASGTSDLQSASIELLRQSPIQCWEALVPSGLPLALVSELKMSD